jgi:hypothetical protein
MNCGHCGNPRDLQEVAKGEIDTEVAEDPRYGRHVIWAEYVAVKRCPRCDQLTIYTYYSYDGSPSYVIYPRPRDLTALPENIRIEYDKAQKAKLVDRGFYALALRRVLEAICSYKGAQGGNLYQKLKYLVDMKSLPEQFAELAHYLREIGNLGAHVGDIEILESDVEAATDFIEAILEYLYIAPAKLKRVTDALTQRRNPPEEIELP